MWSPDFTLSSFVQKEGCADCENTFVVAARMFRHSGEGRNPFFNNI